MVSINTYDRQLDAAAVGHGEHRRMVGGLWDEVGQLQFDHLVAHGLTPEMRLIDIGCGSLRGGVRFVDYLEPDHYYGLDINASLLAAGYDVELARAGLQGKLRRDHLLTDDQFAVGAFGVQFDVALAHSLWTHLPLNHIRRCLIEVAGALCQGGRLFATFFERPANHPPASPYTHQPGGIVTYLERNPYHYRPDELLWCARDLPLEFVSCGPWDHPRAQRMLCLQRI